MSSGTRAQQPLAAPRPPEGRRPVPSRRRSAREEPARRRAVHRTPVEELVGLGGGEGDISTIWRLPGTDRLEFRLSILDSADLKASCALNWNVHLTFICTRTQAQAKFKEVPCFFQQQLVL